MAISPSTVPTPSKAAAAVAPTNGATKKKSAPANETKEQRFSRLAKKSVKKALSFIGKLGELKGGNTEQHKNVITLLATAVKNVETIYNTAPAKKDDDFTI